MRSPVPSLTGRLGRAFRPAVAGASMSAAASSLPIPAAASSLLPLCVGHRAPNAPAATYFAARRPLCRRSFGTSCICLRADSSEANARSRRADARDRSDEAAPAPDARPTTSVPPSSPSAAAILAAKRKTRSGGAKHSLRRVAVMAQQQPRAADAGRPVPGQVAAATAAAETATATASESTAAVGDSRSSIRGAGCRGGSGSAASGRATAASARMTRLRQEAKVLGEADAVDDADGIDGGDGRNVISAVCLAESFDMERVMAILEAQGFRLDPDGSGFESHEVVHARKWWWSSSGTSAGEGDGEGASLATTSEVDGPDGLDVADGTADGWREVDLFVFESGTLVGWGLRADAVDALATQHLVAAAADPFVALRETETLEVRRDASRETSAMRGDVVVLGTRREAAEGDRLATTRAQIAFSSGLARSTKLAVLEASFTDYFESTRRIPEMLAGRGRHGTSGIGGIGNLFGGSGLGHLSQKFILQKTGELLSLRAQLNHYRELTDALPDIFWDARAELGLEGYYEQVGRALDVGVRIKTLNQKMDYAQEIATVLREISSERHGSRLEWIIIVLITVEVVFELRRVYLDMHEDEAAGGGRAVSA